MHSETHSSSSLNCDVRVRLQREERLCEKLRAKRASETGTGIDEQTTGQKEQRSSKEGEGERY